jgi:hypothetical protein
MRRIFHLSCAAQLGQLSFRATALLDSYESGGIRVLSLKRLRCCSAGVSPAFLRFGEAAKISGETPALQKPAYGIASVACFPQ